MAKAKKAATPAANGSKKSAKTKSPAPAGSPMVDTGLAAEAAAKQLVAGLSPAVAATGAPQPESASFKNFKQSLNKPTAGLAGILDKTAGPGHRKPNSPFYGGKQTGRNQTFGADVNRSGVPRRTGGG